VSALVATTLLVGACGSSDNNASITITAPNKGDMLTLANDDVDPKKDGLQYNVTATASGLGAGTGVILTIEGESDASIGMVNKDGSIMFPAVTLPSGKHTIKVATNSGDVHSPDDWDYTFKALSITSPRDGQAIGLADDKDTKTDGIQVNVTVQAFPDDLSEPVSLLVDNQTKASDKHPDGDGKVVFSGITLDNGDHELKAIAGSAESSVVNVSVNPNCASASFVTPEPPDNGDPLMLGGDKCPSDGGNFTTEFQIATDAGENRDVDLFVNDNLVASTKVHNSVAKFTDIVLDRRDLPNKVEVQVQGAQGVTCNRVPYPVDIQLDCGGVDCSLSAPKPVAGFDASGNRVFYLNGSQRSGDGFEFQVHTYSSAIGKAVKLIIDGNEGDAASADPMGSDPNVTAKFPSVQLSDGKHTVQARCEDKDGAVNYSNKSTWIVDTTACGVDITRPSAGTQLVGAIDKDKDTAGVQVEVDSDISGDGCTASRAAVCDPKDGIKDGNFTDFDGGSTLTSNVTLTNDASQTLCVEVQDRAGNIGRGSVDVKYQPQTPMVQIESPADGDKYNADGNDGYKQDTDTGSADVCNADFDVACTEVGTDVKLHRGDKNGTVFATAKCEKKASGAPDLPEGFNGRAHFAKAVFLPNDSDTTKVVATQALTGNGTDVLGVSDAITLKGDCKKPALTFMPDPCHGGQIVVANSTASAIEDVIAADSTTDTSMAHLSVTSGGSEVTSKDANASNGTYTFSQVDLGGPGSGHRDVTITVSTKDGYQNTGTVSCVASIVFDLPTLTVSAPTDNAVLVTTSNTGRCTVSAGNDNGVTLTATSDSATNRSASVSVNGGTDIPLTIIGTMVSGCVPIAEGKSTLDIKLTSVSTTATATVTRNITYITQAPQNGITLSTVTSPSDRNGKLHLEWAAPTETFDGQLVSYELRCDPRSIDVGTSTETLQMEWWNNARTVALPPDFKPPATSVDVDLRAGESNNCVLRAADASGGLTPMVTSASAKAPFRQAHYAPTSTGVYAGWDIAALGDVDGDGIDDALIGGYGESYLVLGNTTISATPTTTFTSANSSLGQQVTGIGKFNNDDLNDFAIADPTWNGGLGRVMVFFGRAKNAWPATHDMPDAADCLADLCFDNTTGLSFGFTLQGIGDFNNDGRDDFAVGTSAYPSDTNLDGRLYIMLGKTYEPGTADPDGFFHHSIAVDNSTELFGFVMNGDNDSGLGSSVAGLGSFDSTAGADLAVSAFGSNGAMGKVYFMSGRTNPQTSGLTPLTTQDLGFRAGTDGTPSGLPIDQGLSGKFGISIAAVGNVYDVASANNPGTADLAIYAFGDGFYIYPGDSNFNPADRVTVGSSAMTEGTFFGFSICTGSKYGDLDGDGFADVCAAGLTNPDTGTGTALAELFYSDVLVKHAGSSLLRIDTSEGSPLDPPAASDFNSNTPGVVEFVGDLNKDGKPDIAIGGPAANGNQGEFTILY
jgi:hypothetical protein